jgi:hypothetical protein
LWLVSLLLAGCRGAATETPNAQLTSQAVLTAAAQMAQATLTANAAATPTKAPVTPTPTLEPTRAVTVTATSAITPTATLQAGGTDKLEFVLDVTVPDGTQFKPGEAFIKTWRLKNTGTSTWNNSYNLVYISGEQMGAPAAISLSGETPPGGTAEISVPLTAPAGAGTYFGFFMLRGPNGNNFGIGPNGDQPFYVQIITSGTGSGSGTTPPTSGSIVSGVTMAVDNPDVSGECPHIFYFAASFVLSQATTVTYRLEAETGFELTLPAPTTAPLDAGKHTVTYTLEFADDASGWATFHVTAPEDVESGQVNFSLQCD